MSWIDKIKIPQQGSAGRILTPLLAQILVGANEDQVLIWQQAYDNWNLKGKNSTGDWGNKEKIDNLNWSSKGKTSAGNWENKGKDNAGGWTNKTKITS